MFSEREYGKVIVTMLEKIFMNICKSFHYYTYTDISKKFFHQSLFGNALKCSLVVTSATVPQ